MKKNKKKKKREKEWNRIIGEEEGGKENRCELSKREEGKE